MKSLTSFYNKALLKEDFRRFGIVGIGYFILSFLITNMGLINITVEPYVEEAEVMRVLSNLYPSAYDMGVVFVVAFGLGIGLFRYLHSGDALTAMHGMPITRKQIFMGRYLVFSVLFVVPMILNGMITVAMMTSRGYSMGDTARYVVITLVALIIAGYTLFSLTVMFGMLTGSDIFQGVTTLVALVLPAILVYVFRVLISVLIDGLPFHFNYAPYGFLLAHDYWGLGMSGIVLGVLVSILAYVFYLNRDLEKHHKIIVFGWAKKMFVGVLTISIILILCTVFVAIVRDQSKGIYIAIVPSALIGYGIAKMIAEKTWAMYRYYKGLIMTVVIAVVLLLAIDIDIMGYQNYVPDVDEIESVHYSRNSYSGVDDFIRDYEKPAIEVGFNGTVSFYELESFEMMRKVHNHAIEYKTNTGDHYTGLNIVYRLKNSKHVQRVYDNYDIIQYEQPIYESEEYKNNYVTNLYALMDETLAVEVNPGFGRDTYTVELNELKSLLEAYEQDFREQTYTEMWGPNRVANLQLDTQGEGEFMYYLPIRNDSTYTLEWLMENEMLSLVPTAEGIVEAVIYKKIDSEPSFFSRSMSQLVGEVFSRSKEDNKHNKLLNQDQLIQLFELGSDSELYRDDSYQIHYVYDDGYHYSVTLSELPEQFEPYVNYYSVDD